MTEKRTRNRKNKKDLYKREREEIILELNKLIGFQEEKNVNSIMLYELEENKKLKDRLKELSEKEIKKYFSYGKWNYYSKEGKKDEQIIGLLKRLYIEENYLISSKNKLSTNNNIKKQYTQLIFTKILFSEK